MPKVVAVHGVAQQYKGAASLKKDWLPALRDGLSRAGFSGDLQDEDVVVAYYGDLFRPTGTSNDKALDFPWKARDVDTSNDVELGLLDAWWLEAARVDDRVPPIVEGGKARTPAFVQSALWALIQSRFFSHLAERALIGNLKQVRSYLTDEATRKTAQLRLAALVEADTTVLIGHSLGSILAYEGLCAHPHWNILSFVTLGSPLAIPNLIFDRLQPAPSGNKGVWPTGTKRWFNISDQGDVVALVKRLAPSFDGRVEDWVIHNGPKAHDVQPYLTAAETGQAVAAGLKD